MNRLNISVFLSFFLLLLAVSCKTDPQSAAKVDFKRTGNSVVVRLEAEPDRLNPLLTTTNYGRQIAEQIYLYPIGFHPTAMELQPELLSAMPVATDITEGPWAGGVVYDFTIHKAATWDDGVPVTGADYIFTVKALLNPNVQAPHLRPYLSQIKDIQPNPDDPRQFRVTVDQKSISALEFIANTFGVMPEHICDPEGLLADIPVTDFTDPEKIEALAQSDERLQQFADAFNAPRFSNDPAVIQGAGPYRLVEWETGQRIVLQKKENWWGDRLADDYPLLKALPDEIVYKPISNATTAVTALRAEEIDAMHNIPSNEFIDMREDTYMTDRYHFQTPVSLAYYFISVNTNDPILSDLNVRKALAHAVNPDEIIENVYLGFGERTASPVHPSSPIYNQDLQPYAFDIERAKTLLAEAGWEDSDNNGILDKVIDGRRTDLQLTYLLNASSEQSRNIGVLLQDNARKAGFDIVLEGLEPRVLIGNIRQKDYQIASAGSTIPTTWNPQQRYHTGGDNRTGFGNAETDALIDRIALTMDADERRSMYKELQQAIYDQYVEIFLFVPEGRTAVHQRFASEPSPVTPGYQVRFFDLVL